MKGICPLLFSVLAFGFSVSGCTVKEAIEPLKPTPFIMHPERLAKPEYTPFDLAWRSPFVANFLYETVVVDAVRTDEINLDDWVYSASSLLISREQYQERVFELAEYLHNALAEAFKTFPNEDHRVNVEVRPPVEEIPPAVAQELPLLKKKNRRTPLNR